MRPNQHFSHPPVFSNQATPQRLFGLLICLTILLNSCGVKPTPPSPTSTPWQQITSTSEAASDFGALLGAGYLFPDKSDDMEISFLDVTGFQATVNEDAEILQVVFHVRDVPLTATHRQILNIPEYAWSVSIFLDSSNVRSTEQPPDYSLSIWTLKSDLPSGQEVIQPAPGNPETIPFDQLFDHKNTNNQQGDYFPGLNVVADPDLDTITLKAKIPGINSKSAFTFITHYFEGATDQPDHDVTAGMAIPSTPLPITNQLPNISSNISDGTTHLISAGTVHAYPGPEHYEGDILTFEIENLDGIPEATEKVTLRLDQGAPFEVTGEQSFYNVLILPLALNTTGLTGKHTLQITTSNQSIDETYIFEVLPASQRPAQEQNAAWLQQITRCCIFHYLAGTAAGRDINFIAEHFQKAADDFAQITGKSINPKLEVYFIDRIWNNGGFGGYGFLVISYTDRYYGPTVGAAGLETLARHEFSHAAGVGLDFAGDGIDFNYEGLAVYVAGGHYKPEPLAQRAAALFDLGYHVPLDRFIPQHELEYLYRAAMLTYSAETYGQDAVWRFLSADNDPTDGQPGPLDLAIQSTFGISLAEFDAGFQAWMERNDPGSQLDDLRLTIKLQDLRRQYQDTYAPAPFVVLDDIEATILRPEFIPLIMREPDDLANVTFELVTANAQKAIVEANYELAERLIQGMKNILDTKAFEDPLASDYLAIANVLMNKGFDVDEIIFMDEGHAQAQVSTNIFDLQILQLQKTLDGWETLP